MIQLQLWKGYWILFAIFYTTYAIAIEVPMGVISKVMITLFLFLTAPIWAIPWLLYYNLMIEPRRGRDE